MFWNIGYYTKELNAGSENSEEPAQTARVLTIMLAEEYRSPHLCPAGYGVIFSGQS